MVMSAKPGEWGTKAGSSFLNQYRDDIVAAVRRGESIPALAEHYGTAHTNMLKWLQTTELYKEDVKCALVECEVRFPFKPGKLCCSRKHIKRFNARKNNPAAMIECSLPECNRLVLNTKKLFCNKDQATCHYRRIERGFYKRLQSRKPACEVCGEWRVLDEHHVEFGRRGSNKQSRTVWLCPTHHLAMHRRLATYDENGFRWVDEDIVIGLRRKHPALVEAR